MMKLRILIVILSFFVVFLGCATHSYENLGNTPEEQAPSFVAEDAAASAPEASGLQQYCPSNECPEGLTTCPTSKFRCDVNLNLDRNNCGACGFVCPEALPGTSFACVDGRCEMTCKGLRGLQNCDGIVDNGCETRIGTNENCNACGDRCLDPEKPCLRSRSAQNACGCDPGLILCRTSTGQPFCADPEIEDNNCKTCGNQCDPLGDGGPLPPNTYRGCWNATCGALKCKAGSGDCDDDKDTGCETSLLSNEHCGYCGNACGPGEECLMNSYLIPECMCPPGTTLCKRCFGATCFGRCLDTSSDRENCGGCDHVCPKPHANLTYYTAECTFGTCGSSCVQGHADCNGNVRDDCEVDTNSDPMNCGECGHVCDAIAGQACVGGQCVVVPCDGDGGVTR